MTHRWHAHTTLELGAIPEAAPCARAYTTVMLLTWNLRQLSEPAELLVTELMSNAIKATRELADPVRPPVKLRLSHDGTRVLIEVWDATPQPPQPREPDFLAEGGRGLQLVETIGDKWGFYHTAPCGKVVWCSIDIAT